MSPRRLISVLSVCVLASASVVAAQPKKDAKGPLAPAKGSAAGAPAGADAAGSAAGTGEAVQMTEDAPPKDMNGTDENPDAPRDVDGETRVVVVAPLMSRAPGYPIQEALRPLTLPQNMSEVSIAPHFQVSPYAGGDSLRARYGITRQVQIGLTYTFAGFFQDPASMKQKFHVGKAVGLDVTVVLQNWIGVRVGVPMYIDPLAFGLTVGVPLKFTFGDKFAVGGLDDLLSVKISKFAPQFYQEQMNAVAAFQTCDTCNRTGQSRGHLRFSGYGIYQYQPKTALIGRVGLDTDFGTGAGSINATTYFLRAGVSFTPRKYLDLSASLGFDDLSKLGSIGPGFGLAIRI